METVKNIKELEDRISSLEGKQYREEILLKDKFQKTYESLTPKNILKSTFKELFTAPNFKEDVLNSSIGLASGYLSKKLAFGSSEGPFKQILGSFLQMGITNVVTKNADGISAKILEIVNVFIEKKEDKNNE